MDNGEKERFLAEHELGCMVWSENIGYEDGYICDGIPDMGAFFVFKGGMKLAVDTGRGWREIVRSKYWMIAENIYC